MASKRPPPPPPVGGRTQLTTSLGGVTNGTNGNNINNGSASVGKNLKFQTNSTTKVDESNGSRQVNFGASDPRAELLAKPPERQAPRVPLQRQQSTDSIKSTIVASKSGIMGQDRTKVSPSNGTSINQRPSRPLSVGLTRSPMNIQKTPVAANNAGVGTSFLEERKKLKEQRDSNQSLSSGSINTNNFNQDNNNNNNSQSEGVRFSAHPTNNVRKVDFGTPPKPQPKPGTSTSARAPRPQEIFRAPADSAPAPPPRDESSFILPPTNLPPPNLPPPDLPPIDLPPPNYSPIVTRNSSENLHVKSAAQLPPMNLPPPKVPPQLPLSQNHINNLHLVRTPSQELVAMNRSLPPPPPPDSLPPAAMDLPPPIMDDAPPLPPRSEELSSSSTNGYNSECESGETSAEDDWANLEASILAGSAEPIRPDTFQSPRMRSQFFANAAEDEEIGAPPAFNAFDKNMQTSTANINSSVWAEEFLSRKNSAVLDEELYTGGEMGKAGIIKERKARLNSPNLLSNDKKPPKTRVQSVKDVRQVLKQFEAPQHTSAGITTKSDAKSKKELETLKEAGNVKEKNQMIQKSMTETNTPTTPTSTRNRSATLKKDQRVAMLEKQFTSPTSTTTSSTTTTNPGISSSNPTPNPNASYASGSGSSIGFSSNINPGMTKLRTGTISGPPGGSRPVSSMFSPVAIDHGLGGGGVPERRGTIIGPNLNLGSKSTKSLPEIPARKVEVTSPPVEAPVTTTVSTPSKKEEKKKHKEEKKEEKKRLAEQKKKEKEELKNQKKQSKAAASTPPPSTNNINNNNNNNNNNNSSSLSKSLGRVSGQTAIKTKPSTPVVKTRIVHTEDLDPRVYLFEEPDSDQNIVFSSSAETEPTNEDGSTHEAEPEQDNMQIHGAVIHKLIQRLTYDKYPDPKFVNIFLLTYRTFATPSELLTWLKLRFDTPEIEGVDHETFVNTKQMQIRLRVFNVIKQWVSNHWDDFSGDANNSIINDLIVFIDNVMIAEGMVNPGEQLKNLIKKQVNNAAHPSDKKLQFSKNPPPPILPSNLKTSIDVLNLHPEEVARQLTLIEERLYKAIEPSECLGLKWMKDDKETSAKNIISLISRFNDVSRWVASSIVEIYDIKSRTVMMNRFITIAVKCFELNNFNCVMEILSGLQNASVYRLKATFEMLPKKTWEMFEEMNEVLSSHENFKMFRAKLHSVNPPCIPYLGIFLTDLTFIQQGNSDYLAKSKLINFTKMKYVARVIGEIQQYQQPPYCLEPVQPIQDYLLTGVKLYNDNELYEHSLKAEPKKPKK
eukprot:TRINITY_DN1988_c1_g1_i1.p1 TRINITY_DN1988_c1_g1~~TRINITY_DN1988_c1_g1_i1.p1  ORF type:complete len:1287 (-),score=395.26 TRINITY_DN1988_c1_g1_i1:145-4005(-)